MLYGYEAMRLALDAAASGTREGAIDAVFATRDRDSVLGRYSIDGKGDTTLSTYGVYRIAPGGALVFDHAVDSSL
jgi:branched-chain amino acid transport system substrate-binding protein